eukprot:4390647-Amphidinium_carterae.1
MGSVASLGKRPILLGGDWNFEPDDFPIDLVHGALFQRPVSDEAANSLCYMERTLLTMGQKLIEALPFKPDHSVVQIQVDLKKVSQGFHGQPNYEEPTETDGITIANRYLEAKAMHSGTWTYTLVARDVETLWPLCQSLWCRAAEHALGLP